MIQDLHSHTYYSFCGKDKPEAVIEGMIAGGIELIGITDHNYGITIQSQDLDDTRPEYLINYQRAINTYLDHMRLIQEKYRDRVEIKCGIELAGTNLYTVSLPDTIDITAYDYCLIEHLDDPIGIIDDLFAYAKRCGCGMVGVAHTDLPSYLDKRGFDRLSYFSEMAKQNIFWEMNVSYDPTHGYREHAYVKRFFEDEALQETIRESGVSLSVGFDGHRIKDYLPERVHEACKRITAMGIPLAFEKK